MKKADLEREIRRLKKEVRRLRTRLGLRPRARARKTRKISKRDLGKFVRQGKPNKEIARYFRTSESKIKRRIKEFDLTGIRKKGRKPLVKRIKRKPEISRWISSKKYFDGLHKKLKRAKIVYPPQKFVNTETLVLSDHKRNPRGKFKGAVVYYLALQSKIFFINTTKIEYSEKPTNFKEIFSWAEENLDRVLSLKFERMSFSYEGYVAFAFYDSKKPREARD